MTDRFYKWTVLILMVATLAATCRGPVVTARADACVGEAPVSIECVGKKYSEQTG